VKKFRQLHSKTPGHPEFRETPGVECHDRPAGAGHRQRGRHGGRRQDGRGALQHRPSIAIFDYHVIALAGDGCMQEGVAMEAVAFAGHQQSRQPDPDLRFANDVTLDAHGGQVAERKRHALRFKALNWEVQTIDGHDLAAILKAITRAKKTKSGKPQLIIAKTVIGKGIPEVQGTAKGHGEGGAKFIDTAKPALGLPVEHHFFVSDDVRAYFAQHKDRLVRQCNKWHKSYKAWREANPAKAELLDAAGKTPDAATLLSKIPVFPADSKLATRAAGKAVLQPLAAAVPLLVGGSADLYGSTLNYIADGADFDKSTRSGRNLRFGIREHGMAAMANGMAYDGLFRPSIATFLVFADYSRPSMRLAALAKLPVVYIYTHDSVGVGEDGPTHQPIETVSSLRVIPGFDVIRPADPEETAGAFAAALERTDGPTLLALSRQALPTLNDIPVSDRREGVLKGAYVAVRETSALEYVLLACGSELQYAIGAAKQLGSGARVVSMPCFERFARQSKEYRDAVLPPSARKRVSIEAGVTSLWGRWVGLDGIALGIDRFGISAQGGTVFKELGMTTDAVVAAAKSLT
jgi:transketolase